MQAMSAAERTWLETATVREKRVRLELLDSAERLIDVLDVDASPDAGQVIDGSISVDTTRDTLRSFSLTIADPGGYWSVGPGAKLWLDKRIRLSVGYVINGAVRLWDQGIYLLAAPEVGATGGGRVVRLSGLDKSALANGRPRGGLTSMVTIAKGRPVHLAIGDLMDRPEWGETKRNLSAVGAVLPWQESFGPPSHNPWGAATAIAGIPDTLAGTSGVYHLYYNVRGYATFAADPDPLLLAPVWTFSPSDTAVSLLVGARKQIDDADLHNAVLVRGGGTKSAAIVEYLAQDTSQYLGVGAIGRRVSYYNGGQADPLISTAAEAQARAEYELRRLLAWQERIPFSLVELPPLEPWDVIRIVDPVAGIADNYQLLRYTLPLTAAGTMEAEAWRVRRSAS
jgi:hypothetical protein